MSFVWFLLGCVLGGGTVWFIVARQSDLRVAEAESRVTRDLDNALASAAEADSAHRETKDRLIALQLEHQKLETREQDLQKRLAAAETLSSMPGGTSAAAPGSGLAGSASEPEIGELQRIRGIGPALERRLNELGVSKLEQLAHLAPADIERINAQLQFPGRIERERWIEQARAILAK
jgi:predicted flap endonuclease-1-like 5' DNA nuclease